MNEQSLMDIEYTWEAVSDIERDVMESIQDADIPGEFKGTIRIRVDYVNEAM